MKHRPSPSLWEMCISRPMGYPADTTQSLTWPKRLQKASSRSWSQYSSSTSSRALLRIIIISRSLQSVWNIGGWAFFPFRRSRSASVMPMTLGSLRSPCMHLTEPFTLSLEWASTIFTDSLSMNFSYSLSSVTPSTTR